MKTLHFIFCTEEMDSEDPEVDLKKAAEQEKTLKSFLAWLEDTHEYVRCFYDKTEKGVKAQAWDAGWSQDGFILEMELVFEK